ncbi:MAG: hypothetical protein GX442_08825 [Candidatus Riflebacteria bacterium]|nr:hypothetical protein [Candidatus Riflebacteria bacterium]
MPRHPFLSIALLSLAVVLLPVLTGCGGGGGGGDDGGGASPVAVAPTSPTTTGNTTEFDNSFKAPLGISSQVKNIFATKTFAASVRVDGSLRQAVGIFDATTGWWTIPTINPSTGNAVTVYARPYIGTSKTWQEGTAQKDVDDQTSKIEFIYTEYFLVDGQAVACESFGHVIKTGPGQYVYNETGTAKVNGLVVLTLTTNDITFTDANAVPTGGSLTIGISGKGSGTCSFNGTNQVATQIVRVTGEVENYTLTI